MTGRRLRIVLAVSLAANLFLVGLLVGTGLFRDRPRGPRHAAFSQAVEQLDPADADALRALMRTEAEQARPRVQALRAARREVEALMSRPDYDPAAVRSAMTQVRIEETALRDNLDAALIEFAGRLDPEERAAVAPLLRKGGRGGRGDRSPADRAGPPRG